jgi:ubiquinone/menaquinone biosynthesis C-methylase UbiE
MEEQFVRSQKGEIEFRKKLYQQQVEGKHVFDDEYYAEGIENILRDRMKITLEQMSELREKNMRMSPYLEIGAERGQRSLVMENDLDLRGVAIDISYDMLKSCEYYRKKFNLMKSPIRICCDAYNLPFKTGSIPFIFCYETLHHFPDPTPIMGEVHRVLSPGGNFFFAEEPYQKVLHLNLYKKKKRISGKSTLLDKTLKIFDWFFSEEICNEIEYGIVENVNMPLRKWRKAFNIFEDKKINLRSLKLIKTELFQARSIIKSILAYLFGGELSGICRKKGKTEVLPETILDAIVCPACKKEGQEVILGRNNEGFMCSSCRKSYPVINGIRFLFLDSKFKELYSELIA